MIKLISTISLMATTVFFSSELKAQVFGNEWIDYSQKYYQFPVVSTGFYRIDYSTLLSAGIPVNSIDHRNLQLFGRDKEQPLWVETNGDGTFDPGDYLLFYADRNDGWLDSSLFVQPEFIGNPGYSLVNDTIFYFVSWNSSITNLRFVEETDVNFAAHPSTPYVWQKLRHESGASYCSGEKNIFAAPGQPTPTSSFYVNGEGYGDGMSLGSVINYSLNSYAPYTGPGAPNSKLTVHFTGTNNSEYLSIPAAGNHRTRVSLEGNVLVDETYVGFQFLQRNVNFATNLLNNSSSLTVEVPNDIGLSSDNQMFTYYEINYPRTLDLNQYQFDITVPSASSGKSKLEISLPPTEPLVFSFGSIPRKLNFTLDAGLYKTLLPNDGTSDQRVIYREMSSVISVPTLTPVNGTGDFTDFSSVNFDDALLFVSHDGLSSSVDAYRLYRQSLAGGGHNVVVADIEELYLQFSSGIIKHPNAIRRYAYYAYNQASTEPQALFLMGKGMMNYHTRSGGANYTYSKIPTFGYPASDVFLTANLPGTTKWRPLIPTGRIAVTTDQQLFDYLSKVQEYELQQNENDVYDTPNKDWQKQVIHLVGGTDAGQQALFGYYMDQLESNIETELFAGHVMNVRKTGTDPLDPATYDSITSRIQDGISLMTFFGHNGVGNSGFEINLDAVSNWNNQGKYPIALVNSCYNGDIFNYGSKSEEFVNAKDEGVIAYIASTSIGFATELYYYSDELYQEMGRDSYGQTLGKNMQNTMNSLMAINNFYNESNAGQVVLNGDPMIRLNSHSKPEIELFEPYVTFLPELIDLNTDSIEMVIAIKNLGQSITDTFTVEIRRNFPETSVDSIYFIQRPFLHYTDTVRFKMPLQPNISIGLNQFNVKVDIPSLYDEVYDETFNNEINTSVLIEIDGAVPIYPWDFAVVPSDSITILASTINPIAPLNTYLFQLDTTDLFNSPFFRTATVTDVSGVLEVNPSDWSIPLMLEDSMVYFWRVALSEPTPFWREQSFQYIVGKEGWGQDHFFQFKKNGFNSIDYHRPSRTRDFFPSSILLECDALSGPSFANAWYLNGNLQDYATCSVFPQIHVGIVDPVTLEAWATNCGAFQNGYNLGGVNDNCGCRGRSEKYFIFNQGDLNSLEAFQSAVLDSVPDGHYLLIWTPMGTRYDLWNALDSADMYATFQTLGTNLIQPTNTISPFIFFAKKGDLATVQMEISQTGDGAGGQVNQEHMETYIFGSDYLGQETSTLIGPAAKWENVYWKQASEEPSLVGDTTVLQIIPYAIDLTPGTPIQFEFTSNDSLLSLENIFSATNYPYIQLRAFYKDSLNFTPAQVDRWHVLYNPLPEAAIDGSNGYYVSNPDSLFEGQSFDFAVDVKNIFTLDMDSLKVDYWVTDANNVKHYLSYPRQDSLRVGQILRDTITVNTVGFPGANTLWMEVNPYINGSLYVTDQPEQTHVNNLLQLPFYVYPDDINPILDVTFDGRHILNGDIVNPNAEIYITLKDDNEYLVMDDVSDTTWFGVYLTDPSGVQKRIPFTDANGNTIMQWIPANNTNKKFKIVYPAVFETDGVYRLLVQGADRSGNLSGDIEYDIQFEVIHESSITKMMNYPNPFSTSTRFVFTLTGSEVPDDIIIQILTVSGRVVREITESELGPIHIGRNITEYAWDGRDEFGDQLANGLYLYRVLAQINGEDIKQRESGADRYFEKEFGKMYLMR